MPIVLKAQTCSGTVFRDFNGNGTKDTYEPGVASITVKAYNAAGTQLGSTATSSATGAWSITTGTTATVRIEFALPATNADPTGALAGVDYSSYSGTTYGSSVQFVSGNATGVNFAISDPDDYWNSVITPRYVVPCYSNGLATGTAANDPAIISTPYNSTGLNSAYKNYNGVTGTGPSPRQDAITSQVATVWGSAYHKVQKHFYFSTFLKRNSGMADGPGYIYNFDYIGATPSLSGKFNLQGVTPANGGAAIDFGTVTRTGSSDYTLPSDKTTPSIDLDAFAKVGGMSMGDLDLQPGTDYLWTVNLFQKALIRIDVSSNPTSVPSGGVNQYLLSSLPGYPTSTKGAIRPWGLGFNAGKGYLGVVSDASISKVDADLVAYVLQFDPNNIAAGFSQVLSFNPNLKRSGLAGAFQFHYWTSSYPTTPSYTWTYPQPIVSDINFDENGNMILSIMDRWGHQMGNVDYTPKSGSTTIYNGAVAQGDMMKACSIGTGWSIEGTGTCSTGTTTFFDVIQGDARPRSPMGSVALLKGKNEVMGIVVDPHPSGSTGTDYYFTLGMNTYNLTSGAITNWYSVNEGASTQFNGKADGLGDLEFITDPAPIEIGNRVWNDTNKNGIQDPGEAGIDGVIVDIYNGATKVGTATTASGGQYYFNNTNVTLGGATGLLPKTAYTLKISSTQFNNTGVASTPLSGLSLTTANATSTGLAGIADNNATAVSGIATITYTTGGYGQNDHSLDFGFISCPTVTNPSAAQTICAGATGTNISVNTSYNTASGIKFVKFTTKQMAGATPTATEATAIYAGTGISTVTPTGASSPYTATYTFATSDFPNATSAPITYYVYPILNPDQGASCEPAQEIQVTVNPVPTLTAPSNQTLCAGASTTAITFAGSAVTGTTYSWTNNTTSMGLAASGTGNIAAFTATNSTSAAVTATITVTPTANGCTGTPQTFTITVNPLPDFILTKPTACPGNTESVTIGSLVNVTTSDLVSVDGGTYGAYPGGGTITGLSVGIHTIALKNSNGCITTKSITINAVSPNTCIPMAVTKN